ncbi:hypothetical protein C6W19_24270 [Bacillus sp. RJGP41]|nr:hypothetical protein C6W19_24270 [Bacillus sp. RJGP41]
MMNTMEILPIRDLIQDDLGNYYEVVGISGGKIRIVNAVVHLSFKRILTTEFVEEVDKHYGKRVGVGQYFTDMLKDKIERISNGGKGNIYKLSDVLEEYEVEIGPLYERSIGIK